MHPLSEICVSLPPETVKRISSSEGFCSNQIYMPMKKELFISLLATAATAAHSQAIPRDERVEQQVEQTLARLSLDEKIGQMCELTIDVITDGQSRDFCLNEGALQKVFNQYHVGSILNVPKGVAQKPEAWSTLIRQLNQRSMETCAGVSQIYGVDQIHGASYTWGATLFPQEVGQAASFNRDIPRRVSEIAAYESRACLIPWVYSPVMDLGRQPLWSRMWESYGEDVYLNCEMARQAVLGYQGDDPNHIPSDRVAACLKHYMAYGVPVSGKDRTPSSVTEREMREKFFQPFRAAIQAGALSLMVNSGVNNGVPFHANYKYLTTWLKEELQWDGMIVTDWADINNICTRDHVAATKKDAICMAINAGIDMSMVPYEVDFCDMLRELVNEGRVPLTRIDDAVRRILRLKVRLGLLDKQTWDKTPQQLASEFPNFASKDFAREAEQMAEECMVLLKNEPSEGAKLLPLKVGTQILVCGPNADNLRGMNGGWTYTWQGNRTNELAPLMGHYPTFQQALKERFGEANVQYLQGVRWDARDFNLDHRAEDWNQLTAAAERADVIMACVGENSYCETPGNINDLNLSDNQKELVRTLSASGKPIVLVLAEGRPRILRDIEPLCKAVVHTFLPGNYGGTALARLLAGDGDFERGLEPSVALGSVLEARLVVGDGGLAVVHRIEQEVDVREIHVGVGVAGVVAQEERELEERLREVVGPDRDRGAQGSDRGIGLGLLREFGEDVRRAAEVGALDERARVHEPGAQRRGGAFLLQAVLEKQDGVRRAGLAEHIEEGARIAEILLGRNGGRYGLAEGHLHGRGGLLRGFGGFLRGGRGFRLR